MSLENQPKRFHYAWVIFALCFLSVFTALGFNSSTKSLYLAVITEDMGFARSLFSISDSCRYIATAVINLFFGRLVAKYGPRKLFAAGFVCLTLSNVINAAARQLWHFYLGSTFLGIGLAWSTTSLVSIIVEKWFTSNKGTIMGFILASNGLGGAVASQLVSRMIASRADGWRISYVVCAFIMVVVGAAIVLLIRNEPADCGWTALGDGTVSKKKQRGRDWIGIDTSTAFHKPYFYVCLLCVFFTGMCLTCVGNISAAHFRDVGIDPVVIANVVSLGSLILMGSKSSVGFIFDRLGLRVTALICQACAALGMFFLLTTKDATGAVLYKCIIAFGLPLETIMLPLITKECFGQKSYAFLMGLMLSVNTLGYAVSPPIMNYIFDVTGSYNMGIIGTIVIMAVVTVTMQFVITAAHKERQQVEAARTKAQKT